MTTPPPKANACPCCTYGNHTEPCTCNGDHCCHHTQHTEQDPQ